MRKERKYASRLLKLAAFLEKLPPERFSLATWVGRFWAGKQDLSCGTTACAMGWAATMPEFRRLGLRLYSTDVAWNGGGLVAISGDSAIYHDGREDAHPSLRAAKEIFGVDGHNFEDLFTTDSRYIDRHAKPGEVAANIRAFVKRETGRTS